ncbi:Flp pilus assembly complex ATPase component TadA [Pseudenhygromyxa sp. WMMC2535]|uniref:FHA domain-containing protein n=1 Tax=Pseudenhygromyxa sp. WMMC2535 TaxID=2712867 RepID=UPI0015529587|nr:Flp pilus assembly complex ATPase component TadA [Pseudenhygromyxa sp. WMMC2535]
MLSIVVHEKGGRTQRFAFEGDQFTVGREEDNNLLLDRANVSKHHLRFRRVDGTVEVLDLESTNGTYVNGRRIVQPRRVRRSDRIYVGDYILMLEGDDAAIAPRERTELPIAGPDGKTRRTPVAVPPEERDRGEALPAGEDEEDDSTLFTSARRVAAPGVESVYLDRITSRVLQTALVNIEGLDPLKAAAVSDSDRKSAEALIDSMIAELQRSGEIEAEIEIEPLKGRITRELLELGPLTELMQDDEVVEIQVVGGGGIRIVREGGSSKTSRAELVQRRFSGERALVLACRRMARQWGFLVEGAQILEGKVSDGFYMYALLPPTQVETPVLNLRRIRTDANNLSALVQEQVLSDDMREVLRAAIRGSRRLLISASGGVNLDRFMHALAGEVPDDMRVVCISDTGRLGASRPSWVQVRRITDPSDTVHLSDALGVLLRGGVDLLVSQRCRHEDAAAVIDAFSGATAGAVISLWGIDSAHALSRLAALSTVASGAIQALTVALARSVDLLVRVSVGVNGEAMQVIELVEPRVKEGNQIVHMPIFRAMKTSDGSTEFRPTGTVPAFIAEITEKGISVPKSVFKLES